MRQHLGLRLRRRVRDLPPLSTASESNPRAVGGGSFVRKFFGLRFAGFGGLSDTSERPAVLGGHDLVILTERLPHSKGAVGLVFRVRFTSSILWSR